jgi:hypothetical protein
MGVFDNIGWKDGLVIDDGAATNSGITIGATGSGNNVSSMALILQSRTSGGTINGGQLFTDPSGNFHMKAGSATGYVVLDDVNQNAALLVSPVGSTPAVTIVNALKMNTSARITNGTSAFASLGAVPAAGTAVYCTNCTTAATCASGGTGHLATSNGTAWTCN